MLLLSLIIMGRDIAVPFSASRPVYAEASPIDSVPSVQPVRSHQILDISESIDSSDDETGLDLVDTADTGLGQEMSRTGLETTQPAVAVKPEPVYQWRTFTATFYVKDGPGMNGKGITATGTHATEGRTIAIDPKVIRYGTVVFIEGWGYRIAEDCGGFRGTKIDIFMDNIKDIPRAGRIKVRLRIVTDPSENPFR